MFPIALRDLVALFPLFGVPDGFMFLTLPFCMCARTLAMLVQGMWIRLASAPSMHRSACWLAHWSGTEKLETQSWNLFLNLICGFEAFFFVFLDGAGGLPGQFGTFYEILAPTKFPTFFGKIFLHNSPPT